MKKFVLVLAALFLCTASAQALTATYDWEDGGDVLGTYGAVTASSSSDQAHSGNLSLKLVDGDSGTPQAFVGWVTGLTDGDTVTASFWVYDTTPGASPSGRIWGHYTLDDDVDSYKGSASGNYTYSAGTGWSMLEHTWTFDSDSGTRDGLMIEARTYNQSGVSGQTIYVDDIAVHVDGDNAVIHLPGNAQVPVPGAIILLGSGVIALAGLRRKN